MTNKREKINGLREEIDAIDARLLEGLSQRQALVRHLVALKKEQGSGFFRPAREVALIHKLVGAQKLDGKILTYIWRQIIAASLDAQKPHRFGLLREEAGGAAAAAETLASAKSWSGAQSEIEIFTRPLELFTALEEESAMIGFVPCAREDSWWRDKGENTFIVARWNYIEDATTPPLFILARQKPEPSGDDCAVLVKNNQLTLQSGFMTPEQAAPDEVLLGCYARTIKL